MWKLKFVIIWFRFQKSRETSAYPFLFPLLFPSTMQTNVFWMPNQKKNISESGRVHLLECSGSPLLLKWHPGEKNIRLSMWKQDFLHRFKYEPLFSKHMIKAPFKARPKRTTNIKRHRQEVARVGCSFMNNRTRYVLMCVAAPVPHGFRMIGAELWLRIDSMNLCIYCASKFLAVSYTMPRRLGKRDVGRSFLPSAPVRASAFTMHRHFRDVYLSSNTPYALNEDIYLNILGKSCMPR